jgi:cell division septal protein FtsQ
MFNVRPSRQQRLAYGQKSLRVSQFEEKRQHYKKIKAIYLLSLFIFSYLIYLCLFSSVFRLETISVVGNDTIPEQEVKKLVEAQFQRHRWLFFSGDNYFLFSEKKLKRSLQETYNMKKLSIKRLGRNNLEINLEELPGRLIWNSQNKSYLIDNNGIIIRELNQTGEGGLQNTAKIFDLSNSSVNIRQRVISVDLVNLALDISQRLPEFNVPAISIDHFAVDGQDATFIKLVTPQKLELHLTHKLSAEQQFLKLRTSLEENKVDLNKVNYINLRVEDQVIYK